MRHIIDDRQQMYKARGTRPGAAAPPAALAQRLENLNVQRRESRWGAMLKRRNITQSTMSPIITPYKSTEQTSAKQEVNTKESTKVDKRLEMLKKWQKEKKQQLEKQKANAKPVFKVHHVTAPSSFNISKVYQEIKGKPIASLVKQKSDQEKFRLVTSSTYKFKPPANIKPITSTIAGPSKQKMPTGKIESKTNLYNTRSRKPVTPVAVKSLPKAKANSDLKGKSNTKKSLASTSSFVPPKSNISTKSQTTEKKLKKRKSDASSSVSNAPKNELLHKSRGRSTRRNHILSVEPKVQNNDNIPDQIGAEAISEDDDVFLPGPSSRKNGRKSMKHSTNSSLSTYYPLREKNSSSSRHSSSEQPVTPANKSSSSSVIYVSPSVTMSQGKDDARKKYHRRSMRGDPISTETIEDDVVFLPGTSYKKNGRKSIKHSTNSSLSTDYPLSEINASSNSLSSSEQPVTPANKSSSSSVIYVSPFVTMSRGKDNARKEYHRRSIRGGSDNVQSPFVKKDVTNSTSPKAAATYFSKLLNNQTLRLQMLCEEWNSYKEQQNPAEEVCDMINVAIGQTELLLKKKFRQFQGLIDSCEFGSSEKLVTCLDLHGFWDTVMIQVNNLDQRFDNLERLRKNNWEEILPLSEPKKPTKSKKKTAKKTKASSTSSVRAAIQEARKKQAAMQQVSSNQDLFSLPSTSTTFKNDTPVKTPNSKRTSLRIAVLNSETRRTLSSPGLTMMKITQVAKSAEKTNNSTPSEAPRSILKPERAKSVGRKSKVVLFRDDDDYSSDNKENDSSSNMIDFSPPVAVKTPTRRSSRILKKKN